jgi:hypothetical protein
MGVGPDGTILTGATPCGSAHTTACHWSRWAVVRYQFFIYPFKFKFDHLNTNLIVFFDHLR